jgi:hypothetical protein
MSETSTSGGVSDVSETQGSDISEGRGQEPLTQKTIKTKKRKQGAPSAPVSLSGPDGADAPAHIDIGPEVLRKFGLRYGVKEWPPRRPDCSTSHDSSSGKG